MKQEGRVCFDSTKHELRLAGKVMEDDTTTVENLGVKPGWQLHITSTTGGSSPVDVVYGSSSPVRIDEDEELKKVRVSDERRWELFSEDDNNPMGSRPLDS